MENKTKKNSQILVLRVLSMFLIILCHITKYYSFVPYNNELSQVFNVGVEIFFLISGLLYGSKTITEIKSWLIKRWQKICIPVFLIVIIDVVVLKLVGEKTTLTATLLYAFNLEGIVALSDTKFVFLPCIYDNLGPLWFATIICLCYLLVPLLQLIRKKTSALQKWCIFSFFAAGSFLLCSFADIYLRYFVVFIFGYILSDLEFDFNNTKTLQYIILSVITVVVQFLRLLIKNSIDGTGLYKAYTDISQAIFAFWIFVSICYISQRMKKTFSVLSGSKIMGFLDEISFYVYLTHCLFCRGTAFNIYIKLDNLFLSTVLFFILSFGSAFLLKRAVGVINMMLFRKKCKND